MTTTALHLTASRWRMINAIYGNFDVAGGVCASTLIGAQNLTTDDLHWLGESPRLATAFLHGTGTRLDLLDHLKHGGSLAVIGLRLNAAGRRVLTHPLNRTLRTLHYVTQRMSLAKLVPLAGVDRGFLDDLQQRHLIRFTTSLGDDVDAAEAALLPAGTVSVKLTPKGRTYLPL